jgi:hypothetical protein
VLYVLGRSLGEWAERYANEKDPGIFVLDEVIGYLLTVAWMVGPSYLTLAVGFFVFRFFDSSSPAARGAWRRSPAATASCSMIVVAGLFGFALVMLPARLLIPAQWDFVG